MASLYTNYRPPGLALVIRSEDMEDGVEALERQIERAARAGANVLVVDAYAQGWPCFLCRASQSRRLPMFAPRVPHELWDEISQAAHELGLALVARVDLLRAGATRAPFDRSPFSRRHKHWLVTDPSSGSVVVAGDEFGSLWLAPWLPPVVDYMTSVVAELVESYPVSGLLVDGWYLPSELESLVRVPLRSEESMFYLPGAPEESDEELAEELSSSPYDSFSAHPLEEATARLLRALRARCRRGTSLPLLVLSCEERLWDLGARLVSFGLADGVAASLLSSSPIFVTQVRMFPHLVWFAQSWESPPEDAETSPSNDLLVAASMVLAAARSPVFFEDSSRTEAEQRPLEGDELPEFSPQACRVALLESLAALEPHVRRSVGVGPDPWMHRFSAISAERGFGKVSIEELSALLTEMVMNWSDERAMLGQLLARRALSYARLLSDFYLEG